MNDKIKIVKIFRKDINDLDDTTEKGYLESLTEHDENGNVISEITFLPDGTVEGKYEYIYDDKGNLIEEINYFSENEIAERKTYVRDDKGTVSEAFIHYQDDTKDRINYEYDEKGNLIKKTTINEDGEVESEETFEYQNGKLIVKELKEFGNVTGREEYEYDESGKIVQQTITGDEEDGTIVNTFDEKGNINGHLRYNQHDKLIGKSVYSFDEKGNMTGIVEETPYEKNISVLEYDENGNLISQVQTNKLNEINHTIKRKYNDQNDVTESKVFINMHGQDVDSEYIIYYEYEYFDA